MRPVDKRALLAVGCAGTLWVVLAGGGGGSTYAALSDFAAVHASAQAGVWAPDPPPECGDLSKYKSVIYGTPGNDILGSDDPPGGNHPQVIMGYGGDDTLIGGNQKDCLVGGPGNDHLDGNNGKDILLGGPGDDYLDGGNGKDKGSGAEGSDTCDAGNGVNTIVNCDPPSAASLITGAAPEPLVSADSPSPISAPTSGPTTPGRQTSTPPSSPTPSGAIPPASGPTEDPTSGPTEDPTAGPTEDTDSGPTEAGPLTAQTMSSAPCPENPSGEAVACPPASPTP